MPAARNQDAAIVSQGLEGCEGTRRYWSSRGRTKGRGRAWGLRQRELLPARAAGASRGCAGNLRTMVSWVSGTGRPE